MAGVKTSTASVPQVMNSMVGSERLKASNTARPMRIQRDGSKVQLAAIPSILWRVGSLMGGEPNQVSPAWIASFAGGLDLMPIRLPSGITAPGGTTASL